MHVHHYTTSKCSVKKWQRTWRPRRTITLTRPFSSPPVTLQELFLESLQRKEEVRLDSSSSACLIFAFMVLCLVYVPDVIRGQLLLNQFTMMKVFLSAVTAGKRSICKSQTIRHAYASLVIIHLSKVSPLPTPLVQAQKGYLDGD